MFSHRQRVHDQWLAILSHDEKYKCIMHALRTEALVTAETALWVAAMAVCYVALFER